MQPYSRMNMDDVILGPNGIEDIKEAADGNTYQRPIPANNVCSKACVSHEYQSRQSFRTSDSIKRRRLLLRESWKRFTDVGEFRSDRYQQQTSFGNAEAPARSTSLGGSKQLEADYSIPSCTPHTRNLPFDSHSSSETQMSNNRDQVEQDMRRAALKVFAVSNLRDFQVKAVMSVFQGQDSFLVVSTGAGKSLCYLLPPMMESASRKFALVLSPLNSLMEDQLMRLRQLNVDAEIASSHSKGFSWRKALLGHYRVLYTSPEFFFRNIPKFKKLQPALLMVAVDECHCVSEWGLNFRPIYRRLSETKKMYGRVPIMCLTATATREIELDICRVFQLDRHTMMFHRGSVNRDNIYYEIVDRPASTFEALHPYLNLHQKENRVVNNLSVSSMSSTVIYVSTQKLSLKLANELKAYNVSVAAYHGGMSRQERYKVHTQFVKNAIQVVCATVAFGMGIDKPDIRQVIHWSVPTSVEAFYQQSGRAGRDQRLSHAVLFWSPKDESKVCRVLLNGPQLHHDKTHYEKRLRSFNLLVGFVKERKTCIRHFFLEYCNEALDSEVQKEVDVRPGYCSYIVKNHQRIVRCNRCSVCCRSEVDIKIPDENDHPIDLSFEARLILQCIRACKQKTGMRIPCLIAIGSQSKALGTRMRSKSLYGKGSHYPLEWWKDLIKLLKLKGFVEEHVTNPSGPRISNERTKVPYLTLKLSFSGETFLQDKRAKFCATQAQISLKSRRDKQSYSTACGDPKIDLSAGHDMHTRTHCMVTSVPGLLKDVLNIEASQIQNLEEISSPQNSSPISNLLLSSPYSSASKWDEDRIHGTQSIRTGAMKSSSAAELDLDGVSDSKEKHHDSVPMLSLDAFYYDDLDVENFEGLEEI